MVVLAQVWMEFTMTKSLQIAGEKNIVAPRHIRVYMDDIFGILKQIEGKNTIDEFNTCLNAVHPRIRFTHETEVDQKLPFFRLPPTSSTKWICHHHSV
jgi:hypothetical protein